MLHPISELLCRAYSALLQKGEVTFPLHDEQRKNIDSVVKTVLAAYYGEPRYPSPEAQAAAYFYFLIKNHPLTDGNKRLAVLWLELFCGAHRLAIKLPEGVGLDQFAVAVEAMREPYREALGITQALLFSGGVPASLA